LNGKQVRDGGAPVRQNPGALLRHRRRSPCCSPGVTRFLPAVQSPAPAEDAAPATG